MAGKPPPKLPLRKQAAPKLSAVALRELAQAHTEAALQALVEVASTGNSEASRISAAMALLDRGYGKSGVDGAARAPTLYQRIELVDGTADDFNQEQQASDRQD